MSRASTTASRNGSGSGAGSGISAPAPGKRESKAFKEVLGAIGFQEVQGLFSETPGEFKSRWLFDNTNPKEVMAHSRKIIETKPHPFVQWLVAARLSFYNAGFTLGSATGQKATADWLKQRSAYPFARLARDVWKEYQICSNVVAFWKQNKADDTSRIAGLPRVTIFDCDRVDYTNDFGVEIVSYTPIRRKLTPEEKRALGPRYADAIENGKKITLDPRLGEMSKVLSTAKSGYGLAMPRWRAIMDDLAILDLLKIGDWNGAWARKKLLRHGKKGHDVVGHGPLAGQPVYFFRPEFGKKLTKLLNDTPGFSELMTNFDLDLSYNFLSADFFENKVYAAVELRLDRWAGPLGMMMREGTTPSPYLMPIFKAEGTAEREIVGDFLADILNDPSFVGKEKAPSQRIIPQWDDTVFFNEKMLLGWFQFAYQNGLMSPQTCRRFLALSDEGETESLTDAHTRADDYTPVFEAKQGLLSEVAGGQQASRTGAAEGGRPSNV